MLKWVVGGAAVLFLGPAVMRAIAANPDAVRRAADMTDDLRRKTVDVTKQATRAAYSKAKTAFSGVMCSGGC